MIAFQSSFHPGVIPVIHVEGHFKSLMSALRSEERYLRRDKQGYIWPSFAEVSHFFNGYLLVIGCYRWSDWSETTLQIQCSSVFIVKYTNMGINLRLPHFFLDSPSGWRIWCVATIKSNYLPSFTFSNVRLKRFCTQDRNTGYCNILMYCK